MTELSGKQGAGGMSWQPITAAIGALAGLATLIFLFFPNLQPKPDPGQLGATLSDVQLAHNVSLNAFLLDRGWPTESYTDAELATLGVQASVNATTTGFKGHGLTLSPQVFNVATGQAEALQSFMNKNQSVLLTPEADTDSAIGFVWAGIIGLTSGDYFVRITITDDEGVAVRSIDSPTYHVNAVGLPLPSP